MKKRTTRKITRKQKQYCLIKSPSFIELYGGWYLWFPVFQGVLTMLNQKVCVGCWGVLFLKQIFLLRLWCQVTILIMCYNQNQDLSKPCFFSRFARCQDHRLVESRVKKILAYSQWPVSLIKKTAGWGDPDGNDQHIWKQFKRPAKGSWPVRRRNSLYGKPLQGLFFSQRGPSPEPLLTSRTLFIVTYFTTK